MSVKIEYTLDRDTSAFECPKDHGFSEKVEGTKKEQEEVGCYVNNCCNVAFVCKICGERYYASLHAPEMDW